MGTFHLGPFICGTVFGLAIVCCVWVLWIAKGE